MEDNSRNTACDENRSTKKYESQWSYIKGDIDDLIFYGEQDIGQSER